MRNATVRIRLLASLSLLLSLASPLFADAPAASPEKSVDAPNGQTIGVKMIGPVTQDTDLQVLCILKHEDSGDKYIEAMKDLNGKLGMLLSSLRDRGEFGGDLGETLLFIPPKDTIAPKRVLLIGIGEESKITLEKLNMAGRIAAREAVRLKAANVSFAPTLRDQGSTRIEVGEGDAATTSGWIAAYDTEKRLQKQKLGDEFDVKRFTIEAGPKYFESAFSKVSASVTQSAETLKQRDVAPYSESK
jgi:hypothetical protein